MRGDDTHCSRCGAALTPVPVFTRVEWECPCVPAAKAAISIPTQGGRYSLPTCASMGLPITIRMAYTLNFPMYLGSVLKVIYLDVNKDSYCCECIRNPDGSVPPNGYTQVWWPAEMTEEQFEVVSG